MSRVAYQGMPGAFSEEAARLFFTGSAELVPLRTLEDVFAALTAHDVDFAVVPTVNTLAGDVPGCLERIRESGAREIDERVLRIAQAAIGVPGANLSRVRVARSHPVALAQCAKFFEARPHIVGEETFDTAGAVADLMRAGDPSVIAIGSARAARHYGAEVLVAEIQDVAENFTRFVLLG